MLDTIGMTVITGKGFSFDLDLTRYAVSIRKYIKSEIEKDKFLCGRLRNHFAKCMRQSSPPMPTINKAITQKIAGLKAI